MKFAGAWLDEGQKCRVTRGRAGTVASSTDDSHPCLLPGALYSTPRVNVFSRADAVALDTSCQPANRIRTKHLVNQALRYQ